jgi:uncharacterized delta-60 repeat protein
VRKYILRSALLIALLATLVTSTLAHSASAAPLALAAPGALDPTFGGFTDDGIVVESGLRRVEDMALQLDGKIVVVGDTGTNNQIAVFRYLSNGTLDLSFSGDGKAIFSDMFAADQVALQSDGKIVVGGTLGGAGFNLARLNQDGTLDTSFDQDGWLSDHNLRVGSLRAILVQGDGKIVACGRNLDDDFSVARYNANGSRDTSFGGGVGIVGFGFGNLETCTSITQWNGKLVLAGRRSSGIGIGDVDFAVARLNSNGTLDSSFDGDGRLTTGFGDNEEATDVAVQPDGKIVALGSASGHGASLARYNSNGSLDTTFDGDGKLSLRGDDLGKLALQPDGKLVALGDHISPDGDIKFVLYRLHPNGALDTSFDFDGSAAYDFGGQDWSKALVLQPDGRILAAGGNGTSAVLIRLWPSGTTPDTGGQQTYGYPVTPGANEFTSALAVQNDGKLLVAGEHRSSANSRAFVSRFLPDGQIDAGFNAQLDNVVPPGTSFIQEGVFNAAHAIAVQADGKIVIAGYVTGRGLNVGGLVTDDFLIARFLPNGAIDRSFSTYGFYRLDFAGGADRANAIAVNSDGKIVVAGSATSNGRQMWGVARLTASGAPDTSFGGGLGKALFDFGTNSTANAVVLQRDGKIVLGGKSGAEDFVVARLLTSGALDTTFGPNGFGYNITNIGGADAVVGLKLATNGWIYAAGFSWQGGTMEDFVLAQYQPNGTLPQCSSGQTCAFWPGGLRFINVGGSDSAYSLVMRSDNELVAAGCSDGQMAAAQVSTTNINAVPLVFKTDFVGEFECANGVQFSDASKTKIVLAGWQSYNSDYNIGLARFQTTSQTLAPAAPSSSEPNAAPEVSADQPATDSVVQETPADDVSTPTPDVTDDIKKDAPAEDVSTPTDTPDRIQKDAPADDVSTPTPDDMVKDVPAEDVSTNSNDIQP